jgi:hypothetical protein
MQFMKALRWHRPRVGTAGVMAGVMADAIRYGAIMLVFIVLLGHLAKVAL